MAKATPGINQLNGGEVSPLIDCRWDLGKYGSCCKTMENAVPLVEGGARKMPGTYYVDPVQGSGKSRMVRFSFSNDQSYALEFSAGKIRILYDDGIVQADNDIDMYDAATEYFTGDIVQVGYCYLVIFLEETGESLFIYPEPDQDVGELPIYFRINSSDNLSLEAGDGYIIVWFASTTASKNAASNIQTALRALASTPGIDVSKWVVAPDTAYYNAPAATVRDAYPSRYYAGIYQAIANNQYHYPPPTEGKWTDDVVYADPGDITVDTPYAEADLFDLDVSTQSADVLYIFHKNYPAYKLKRYSHTNWQLEQCAFSGTPDIFLGGFHQQRKFIQAITKHDKCEIACQGHGLQVGDEIYINDVVGMLELNQGRYTVITRTDANNFIISVDSTNFSEYDSGGWFIKVVDLFDQIGLYPAHGTLYEQRLILSGFDSYPHRIVGSLMGDFESFITDPELDDYAIQYDLVSQQVGEILWMVGHMNLLIGTANGVWVVSGADGNPLTQTSIDAKMAITYGSSAIPPQVVNDSIVWFTRVARTARLIQYDYASDKWISPDLTRIARHIMLGEDASESGILQTAFQQEPYPILWAVRGDGELIGMTYESQESVYAWFRVVTDGVFESICVVPQANDEDRIWVVVKRTINGSDVRYIEYFKPFELFGEITDSFFLHSGLTYDGTATTSITGLSHLEGESVYALADGLVQGPFTVSSGEITLTTAASLVHVGLPYEMTLEPVNPIISLSQGPSRGKKQKINRVTLCLHESNYCKVGIDENHLLDIACLASGSVSGVPHFTRGALYSDDITVDLQGDWLDNGTICIVHDKPTPFLVKAILPRLNVNEES